MDRQVLIRLRAVGICGSDVHLFFHDVTGNLRTSLPYVLGHEASGEIVATGKLVKALKIGDRVVIEPGVPCGSCEFCRLGRYNLCESIKFLGSPPVPGVLREYVAHEAAFCHKIKGDISFDVASLAEPLSVGVYAAQRARVGPGKTVAILGMGPIGQTALQAVRGFGATAVMVADIVDNRLKLARQLGAQKVVNSGTDNVEALGNEFSEQKGFDVVIEASGAAQALSNAVNIAKNGATIVLVGNLRKVEPDFPIVRAVFKELQILGSYRYCNTFPTVIDMLAASPNMERLITHHFQLEECQRALEIVRDNKADCMKVVVEV